MDSDSASDLFSSYEAEFKLAQAHLNQSMDRVGEVSGEQRKSAVNTAQRALEDAKELVRRLALLPSASCG